MIFVIGFAPGVFLDRMKPSVDMFHSQFKTVSGQAVLFADDHAAKLLPEDVFPPRSSRRARSTRRRAGKRAPRRRPMRRREVTSELGCTPRRRAAARRRPWRRAAHGRGGIRQAPRRRDGT